MFETTARANEIREKYAFLAVLLKSERKMRRNGMVFLKARLISTLIIACFLPRRSADSSVDFELVDILSGTFENAECKYGTEICCELV